MKQWEVKYVSVSKLQDCLNDFHYNGYKIYDIILIGSQFTVIAECDC